MRNYRALVENFTEDKDRTTKLYAQAYDNLMTQHKDFMIKNKYFGQRCMIEFKSSRVLEDLKEKPETTACWLECYFKTDAAGVWKFEDAEYTNISELAEAVDKKYFFLNLNVHNIV